jgi:protein-tyrosine phosphatase
MRLIPATSLWLGHAGDARDLRAVLAAGIDALVDLAVEEPPAKLTREIVYARFPLVDGSGNAEWLLRAALVTTTCLLRERTPTLIFCGAGMSRSPAVAAGALALHTGRPPEDCLAEVLRGGPGDVSPALGADVRRVLAGLAGQARHLPCADW